MANAQEKLEYWRTTYGENLNEMASILSTDFDHMKIQDSISGSNIIGEKPENIPQHLWDNLFIKRSWVFYQFTLQYSPDYILFLEIDGVKIGTFNSPNGLFFAFDRDISSEREDDELTVHQRVQKGFSSRITNGWATDDRFKIFLEGCIEYYGEDNVWAGFALHDPEMCAMYNIDSSSPVIITKHPDFWCYDKYGIGMKVMGGLSYYKFRSDGKFMSRVRFTATQRDQAAARKDLSHPHTPTRDDNYAIHFKNICRGDTSPINSAISAYTDSPRDDELVYNVILNYENLLKNEDEEGVPHWRMRKKLLDYSERENVRRIDRDELYTALREGDIDIHAYINSNSISVEVDKDSLNSYANSIAHGANGGYWYHEDDGLRYEKSIIIGPTTPKEYGFIYFNGIKHEVSVLSHDPNRFDLSGMSDDNPYWNSSNIRLPSDEVMTNINRKLSSIANLKLIMENDVNEISFERIKEELIGLSEIRRNSNINDIIGVSAAN